MTAQGGAGIARFYDDLSAHYHLLFADWDAAVERQGRALDGLIGRLTGPGSRHILDAACGIGTQALGLARRGHRVHGSDLSAAALARAAREARRLGLRLDFDVADLGALAATVPGRFEVVCALDNALPHLPGEAALARAIGEMAGRLAPGGLFLASIRDYDVLLDQRPRTTPPRVFDDGRRRRVVFQVWDWAPDGSRYRLELYIVRSGPDGADVRVFATDYWPVRRDVLSRLIERAGLVDVRWFEPPESGFHQPLVAARVGPATV